MVTDFPFVLQSIAWPLVLLLAWVLAERAHELWHLPRVATYVAVGLFAGLVQLPGWTANIAGLPFLANLALGLLLFELGHRIHLRWFKHNPWLLGLGLVESLITFVVVYEVALWWGVAKSVAPILAALSISASPAGIVRVVNELRSAGQVTERVVHLCAINCLVSVLALKLVIAQWTFNTSGDVWLALVGSVHVVFTSVLAGGVLGVAVPWLLRWRRANERGVTLVFALSVLLLTTLSFGLQLSPLLAALTFGIVARERRILLTNAQRDFGAVGDLLTLFLFVYIASLMDWSQVWGGVGLAVVVIAARTTSKVACNVLAAYVSGITRRKGALTGLALTPMSVFAIVLLEHSRTQGFGLANEVLVAMTAMMVLQELIGPVVTQRALMAARETHVTQETRHGT